MTSFAGRNRLSFDQRYPASSGLPISGCTGNGAAWQHGRIWCSWLRALNLPVIQNIDPGPRADGQEKILPELSLLDPSAEIRLEGIKLLSEGATSLAAQFQALA